MLLERFPAALPAELSDSPGRSHGVIEVVYDETRAPVLQHLGDRPAAKRDHGRAARESLDHHEPERLGPVDREQEHSSVTQEFLLLTVADLTDVLDERVTEQRLDDVLEVVAIDR